MAASCEKNNKTFEFCRREGISLLIEQLLASQGGIHNVLLSRVWCWYTDCDMVSYFVELCLICNIKFNQNHFIKNADNITILCRPTNCKTGLCTDATGPSVT